MNDFNGFAICKECGGEIYSLFETGGIVRWRHVIPIRIGKHKAIAYEGALYIWDERLL